MEPDASLVYSPWSECSASCGNGWQTRTATCLAADGSLLAMQQCPEAADAVTSRACKGLSCTAPYWLYSAWSACSASCGSGTAERNATCEAPKGKDCDKLEQQPLEQQCNNAACAVFAWQAGEWSTCDAECGGGNQTRYVACVDTAGVVAEEQLCVGSARPADTQACALQPCDFCSANDCFGQGTCSNGACVCDASQNVTGPFCQVPTSCTSGVVDRQLACCPSGLVDASGACCPAGATLDASGACCAGGTVDACGVCGGKGKFVDTAGACCATLLDADGQCCASGAVDECGVCNGLGTSCAIDMTLQLTVSPELVYGDAVQESALNAFLGNLSEALLLPEGAITLGSLQETAPSTSDLAISEAQGKERALRLARLLLAEPKPQQQGKPAAAAGNATQGEDADAVAAGAKQQGGSMYLTATVSLSPDAAAQSGGQFSAAWMSAALGQVVAEQSVDSPVQLGTNNQVTRAAVCGNGICEVGERTVEGLVDGTCPQDCSFETKACPESCGAGTCQPATGACTCFVGYAGQECNECAAGFSMVNGACSADVVALGFVSPAVPEDEAGTQADASNNVEAPSESGGPNVGAIVGPIVAVVVVAAAVAAFVIHRRRSRAFRNFGTPSNSDGAGGGRDLESQYTTAQGEVGSGSETRSLREKYGSMSSLGTGGAPTPPTQSAAPSGAPSAAHSAGTVSSGGGRRLMQASQEALALRSSQQAFRGLAAGASQLSRGDSQLHSTGSLGGPARTRSTAGAPNPLRQSLTASTGCNAGGSTLSGSALVASAAAGATFASATPVLGDTHHTLKSVSSSGRGGSRPDSAAHSSSNNSGTSSGHSGQAQPAASALDSSHLMAESPAMVEAASMAVHPFMSPHPSMPVSPAQVAGAPTLAHLAGVMMQSYTSSPLDPQARLFYNPAFNDESIPRMSDSKSVLSSSHVPKPGYLRRMPSSALVSAEPSSLQPPTAPASDGQPASEGAIVVAAAVAAELGPAAGRRMQAVNLSIEESLDTQARRDKLDRLREAVEALEADAALGAGGKRVAGPGELQSPSGSQPLAQVPAALRVSVDSVTWAGKEEQEVSPLALSQTEGQRKVLDRRPSVPRLPLGRLLSGDQGAQLPPVAIAADEAAISATEAQPLPSRPTVPRLALSKLNPLAAGTAGVSSQAAAGGGSGRGGSGSGRWRPTAQASRIPAANFSTLDATAQRSPTKLPSGAVPADPLDDLDAMLDSATPQRQQSAREALASGLSKLLNPLRGSARGLGSGRRAEDWTRQLSERGRGTPRSWAEDSGMQRTKAGVSLQRSNDELEEESPPVQSRLERRGGGGSAQGPFLSPGDSEAPSSTFTAGTAASLANRSAMLSSSPRGQLLKQLADEATAAQRERAAQEARAAAPAQPTYSEVMGRVDDALRSAGASPVKGAAYGASGAYSPSKLPRAAGAAGGYRSASNSPSKIPRGPSQRNSSADENAGGAVRSARIGAHWQ